MKVTALKYEYFKLSLWLWHILYLRDECQTYGRYHHYLIIIHDKISKPMNIYDNAHKHYLENLLVFARFQEISLAYTVL